MLLQHRADNELSTLIKLTLFRRHSDTVSPLLFDVDTTSKMERRSDVDNPTSNSQRRFRLRFKLFLDVDTTSKM